MLKEKIKLVEKFDKEDSLLVELFIDTLSDKEKYSKLKIEINEREQEIANGETISHDELWKNL